MVCVFLGTAEQSIKIKKTTLPQYSAAPKLFGSAHLIRNMNYRYHQRCKCRPSREREREKSKRGKIGRNENERQTLQGNGKRHVSGNTQIKPSIFTLLRHANWLYVQIACGVPARGRGVRRSLRICLHIYKSRQLRAETFASIMILSLPHYYYFFYLRQLPGGLSWSSFRMNEPGAHDRTSPEELSSSWPDNYLFWWSSSVLVSEHMWVLPPCSWGIYYSLWPCFGKSTN